MLSQNSETMYCTNQNYNLEHRLFSPISFPIIEEIAKEVLGVDTTVEIISISQTGTKDGHQVKLLNTVEFKMAIPVIFFQKPRYKKETLPHTRDFYIETWTNTELYYRYGDGIGVGNLDKLKNEIMLNEKIPEAVDKMMSDFKSAELQAEKNFSESFIKTKHGFINPEYFNIERIEIEYMSERELKQQVEYHCLKNVK